MPRLTNIRETIDAGEPVVCADFRIPDGREGCVCVPIAEYQAHGEVVLQQLADACTAQARGHRYQPPDRDRYAEFR
ncbi:hypothetical protein FHS95_000135 [Sphingomonas naasensis]|uniref:Uncharacterized protein n=1 Tax=Sphingomonas naasensis TaxID=1344951 RepID=A0A4S1WQT8_9SPHN|nr:hypothetical protein [Sphingomonas naasensis]NIJ18466.1 hypothetical protein [Sphingomonas naasensis]TGX45728.1 hypothetical protein E5A74_00660 [Sphingomonas naasensis]